MNSKKDSREAGYGVLFLVIAFLAWGATFFAPRTPDKFFVIGMLVLVGMTLLLLFVIKRMQPKPVNWLTADVLFGFAFCAVHFTYFIYWVSGAAGDTRELWYLGNADCPNTVCVGLAMYACAVNCFLAGYYFIGTRRWTSIIRERRPPESIRKSWGRLGRLMVKLGCCGFCAFIAIVGPARFFGIYSGTNNISFLGNVFFQLGTVFLMSGVTISMVSQQQIINRKKRKSRFSLGVSFIDAVLIAGLCLAIGIHGDRSTLLFLIGAFVVAYSEYVKPLTIKSLAVSTIVLIFFLGFIIAFRSARSTSYDFDPVHNINVALLNIGTSSVCGFVAIDYVETDGYSYGWKQVKQLAGIIPFGRRLFGISDSIENSSSMTLTYLIQGKVGSGVAGTGTSVFADTYFDFGLYGTLCYFLFFGMLAKIFQNRARASTGIIWQVLLVNMITFLAVCSRYTFTDGLIRTVLFSGVYTWFVFYALSVPIRYSKKKAQLGQIWSNGSNQ